MVSLSQGPATSSVQGAAGSLQGIASKAKELVRGVEVTSKPAQDILQIWTPACTCWPPTPEMNPPSDPEAPRHSVE